MKRRIKIIVGILLVHLIACVAASVVFDWSLHRHMPEEATGPDIPMWTRPAEVLLVPVRICLAIDGTLFNGRITLAQRPFADLTATYVAVVVSLLVVWFLIAKRRKSTQQTVRGAGGPAPQP